MKTFKPDTSKLDLNITFGGVVKPRTDAVAAPKDTPKAAKTAAPKAAKTAAPKAAKTAAPKAAKTAAPKAAKTAAPKVEYIAHPFVYDDDAGDGSCADCIYTEDHELHTSYDRCGVLQEGADAQCVLPAGHERLHAFGPLPDEDLTPTLGNSAQVDAARDDRYTWKPGDVEVQDAPTWSRPTGVLAKVIERAGFKWQRLESSVDGVAHGYQRKDGAVMLLVHDPTNEQIGTGWILKLADAKVSVTGKTVVEFVDTLHPVGVPQNVLTAVRTLKRETDGSYDIASLAKDAGYGGRLRTLKALKGTDKVRVLDAEVAPLKRVMHAALGAKNAGDFAVKCATALKADDARTRARKAADGLATEAAVKQARLTAKREPGPAPVPVPKKLSGYKAAEAAAVELKQLEEDLAAKVAAIGAEPIAIYDARRTVAYNVDHARALQFKNGNVCLQLEQANSQGALVVCNNGKRVAACAVSRKDLAAAKTPDPCPSLVDLAQSLLNPGPKIEVRPPAGAHLRAFLAHIELVWLAAESTDVPEFKTPADHLQHTDPLEFDTMGLLEDRKTRTTVLLLERPASQGALCVYNRNSATALGVVPPEILRDLRPLPSTDLAGDVNRLFGAEYGHRVTRAAQDRITAVLEVLQGESDMATKKAAKSVKKFDPPAGAAKKAVVKKAAKEKGEPTARKSSTFRLLSATKAVWSAFTTQKGEIVAAFVKLGAVGKGAGVTKGQLVAALPEVPDKNISFYLTKWQEPGIVEKTAAA